MPALAQAQLFAGLSGRVVDETKGVLPGVTVDLGCRDGRPPATTTTDSSGRYAFEGLTPGACSATFQLLNFGRASRDVGIGPGPQELADVVLYPSLSADLTVTTKSTFTNLADAENPAGNLVGIALSASQGAVTPAQLEARPMARAGEVLETVPGVIISQHSGEGKANQYYLRGFNLDHGTDFATTVAGVPVNLPTHGHGHGYSDLNFLIPELVSGVQFAKGPYFADQGDFATAGSANINYTNVLDRPIVKIDGGGQGWARTLTAGSHRAGQGHVLYAFDVSRSNGPWEQPDDFRKLNGVVRYSRGNRIDGFALTAMGYGASWNSTDQVPLRAIDAGVVGRFGAIDQTDGGTTHRYSLSADWQHATASSVARATAYGVKYDLRLFSNFTYFLDDPERGDQFEQADERFVSGMKASYKRLGSWRGRSVEQTAGLQLRRDDIATVGLYHTAARERLGTVRDDAVTQTSGGVYYQAQMAWASKVRVLGGLRADLYHFDVRASLARNSGTNTAGLVSPKGGVVFGPWKATEVYANAGHGFHSNDARGATIRVDPQSGEAVDRVTPLARAIGAEVGIRTVAVPHMQSTFTLWTLDLASELVFVGDAGTTEASRPSRRTGIEWTNYVRPASWLTLDADVAVSRARFTDPNPVGSRIPGSVRTVVSAGAALDGAHRVFGSVRLRYFGPRALTEDDAVRSKATATANLQVGCRVAPRTKLVVDVFNLTNARESDIDYFYTSRLPGEPASGVDDVHLHPAVPRVARISLSYSF
ncbi:MAG: TonB-dependent receptor [Vicinamibacterales bacterium]